MSDNNMNQYFWADPTQELEQADLHSPVFPPDDHESFSQDPFSLENLINPEGTMDFHLQANEGMTNLTEESHTRVELPNPLNADNSTGNLQSFNDFFGSNDLFPAPVGFEGPSNTFPVNIMQPVPEFPELFDFNPPFRHSILNAFPSPRYPLQIIDSLVSLSDHVIKALHQGLKRQREHDDQISQLISNANIEPLLFDQPPAKKRQISKGKGVAISIADDSDQEELALSDAEPAEEPKVIVKPIKVPGKKWIKPNMATQGKNKRSKNIQSLDPSNFYQPLEQRPQSWGTANRDGIVPFQYTDDGELNPHIKFSSAQMKEFIFNHPGHTMSGQRHTKRSGLTLWIQSVPSDSAARYPHQNSDKCRFENCPVRYGTIHKGHYRVAFDEQSSDPVVTDPFHNAGHVHLYCLEKFLDFPFICANFNVRPDDRFLPEGRNKMAITRDHVEMKKLVKRFVRDAEREQADQRIFEVNQSSYENTLSYRLTMKHLELEPANRQSLPAESKKTLAREVGSLSSATGKSAPVRRPAQAKGKRKVIEIEDTEFEIDDKILDSDGDTLIADNQGQTQPSTRQSKDIRPVKRARLRKKPTKKFASDSDDNSSSSDDISSSDGDVSDWQPAKKSKRTSK
ncbi:hypothetical protein EYC84_007790 [Monilinia fructicola]|uniref:Uncharacterized protein n=1 Tax=Monilinia fructicola TaxID=38448 RepID=A0A5M9JM22_MONFR|nr:hypothetical protein EYC84_007790 [Monilinia fructicola]